MNRLLYTKATAAEADYEAAFERTFGAAACDARYDRARNGSQADHPLHPAYITKTEAAIAWIVGKNWKKQIRVRGRYKPSTALTSLAERPVFSLRRREFFPSARAEKPRKTADYPRGPGTCIGFPAGTGDGHHFLNLTQKDAIFLVIGDRTAGDEVTHPDIDLELKAGPDGVRGFRRKDGTPYPRAAPN